MNVAYVLSILFKGNIHKIAISHDCIYAFLSIEINLLGDAVLVILLLILR